MRLLPRSSRSARARRRARRELLGPVVVVLIGCSAVIGAGMFVASKVGGPPAATNMSAAVTPATPITTTTPAPIPVVPDKGNGEQGAQIERTVVEPDFALKLSRSLPVSHTSNGTSIDDRFTVGHVHVTVSSTPNVNGLPLAALVGSYTPSGATLSKATVGGADASRTGFLVTQTIGTEHSQTFMFAARDRIYSVQAIGTKNGTAEARVLVERLAVAITLR